MLAFRNQQAWDDATPSHNYEQPRSLPPRLSHSGLEAAALLCSLQNADQSRTFEMPVRDGIAVGYPVEPEPCNLAANLQMLQSPIDNQPSRRQKGPRVSFMPEIYTNFRHLSNLDFPGPQNCWASEAKAWREVLTLLDSADELKAGGCR